VWDLTKNEDNENPKHGNERGMEDSTQRITNAAYFYYLYHNEDSFPSVQVEALSDLRCPLCSMLMVCVCVVHRVLHIFSFFYSFSDHSLFVTLLI
jgi:hypothetical protein